MSELNRCGCGGRAYIESWGPNNPARVVCTKCYITTQRCPNAADAVSIWNRAIPNPLAPERVDALLSKSRAEIRHEIKNKDARQLAIMEVNTFARRIKKELE